MHAPTASIEAQPRARTGTDALARAVLAGFAASLTMLLVFLVAFNVARLLSATPIPSWPQLERPSIIHPASWVAADNREGLAPGAATDSATTLAPPRSWLVNLTNNRLIDAGLADVYLAAGIYLAGGLLWAALYTLVEPRLSGPDWKRGVIFAMLPALVSLVVVLPLLGGGLFGLSLGAGPLPAIGNVLLHVVYGAILGVVYGSWGDLDASTLERPAPTVEGSQAGVSYEPITALALLAGLVLGGVVGLIASFAASSGALPMRESSGSLILWGALLGAVIGLFVGSFLGLGRTAPRHPDA
jgi:hypothetical protein